MKKLLLLTLILAVAATGAVAKEAAPLKPLDSYPHATRAAEVEPNDDCATATAITEGDPMEAAITPAGDLDYFEFVVTATNDFTFETFPGMGQSGGDTQMTLYADDCSTQLDYDDDGGTGLYSMFTITLGPGTYYAAVNEYGNNGEIGAYVLEISVPAPPPANDTCAGAINLDEMPQSFMVDTCDGYTNAYFDASSCTNYSANGPDAIYYAVLPENGQIDVCIDGAFDLSLYLVTDCGDIAGSCVAGDDSGNPECISYTGGPGTYYLIVDGYSGCGEITVTIDNLVPTEETSFSTIKSLF